MGNGGPGDSWKGRSVLVTGGDGFVGTHLVNTLLERGAFVVTTSRRDRPFDLRSLLFGPAAPRPEVDHTDLADVAEVTDLCRRQGIDTIFHLAAHAIVGAAARAPWSTFDGNIRSTLSVLEAGRITRTARVLIASSDKVYGDHADVNDPQRLPSNESHTLRGVDAYSASKVCVDTLAHSYALQFEESRVLVARCCNVYGPGDVNFTRLIPQTCMRLRAGVAPVIYPGSESVLREYMHVRDVVAAYLVLASHVDAHYAHERPTRGLATHGWAAYNVGTHDARQRVNFRPEQLEAVHSVGDVIRRLSALVPGSLPPTTLARPPGSNVVEISDQYLDAGRLLALGFAPREGFDAGLRETLKWYDDNSEGLGGSAARFLH